MGLPKELVLILTKEFITLGTSKRITVIPIIKDEGKKATEILSNGTRFRVSLLDVFAVFAYYKTAEKHKTRANKITNQQFDNELVKQKISEIKTIIVPHCIGI